MKTPFLVLPGFILISALFSACTPNDTPPAVSCTPTPLAEPVSGWRFTTDPSDKGLTGGWSAPEFDDSGWRTDITPGKAWEQQGLDYDGIGWFRTKAAVPAQKPALMAVSGVDDTARLWVDGQQTDSFDHTLKLADLSAWAGKTVTLVFRVVDTGGYGGIKDAVRIGGSPEAVLTPSQWAGWLAGQHPDWPLPGWTRGGGAAWAMTGGLNAANEALVSSEGRVAPWATAPTAIAWVGEAGFWPASPQADLPSFGLVNDHLPMPRWVSTHNATKATSTLFFDETDKAVRWTVEVDNSASSTAAEVRIAVTPFAANQTAHPITQISATNAQRVWVNGQPYLVAANTPDRIGAGRLAEVMGNSLPDRRSLDCAPAGDAAAVLSYTIPAGQTRSLAFAFPSSAGADFPPQADPQKRLAEATQLWEDQTTRMKIGLPDGRIQNAFQASIGTMLLALDPATPGTTGTGVSTQTPSKLDPGTPGTTGTGVSTQTLSKLDPGTPGTTGTGVSAQTPSKLDSDGPHPGPLAHDSLWVRDATYIGLGLLQTGHAEEVKAYLPHIWEGQSADGRVPPISGTSIPWTDDEWDAQGEAIYLTVMTARYTGDIEMLKTYYPQIRKAADFIRTLRGRNTGTGAAAGLLPPSLSAEDLGPGQAHYYWDDLWAVTGQDAAALAAGTLGYADDASWMTAEKIGLSDAILKSVTTVMGDNPAYIPGSVEETKSSSAARGTVPALWPDEIFPPVDPLIVKSFDFYHTTWIEPYGGGFLHRDAQFWPVGGLELAHAYLALGRGDVLHQILGWTLSHQTLPGTYAWADEVSPTNGGVAGGDMPHAWVAASYVTLIREMLIRERNGGQINPAKPDTAGTSSSIAPSEVDLFTLAPEGWFESGNVISVENAPTWYGPLSIKTASTVKNQDGHWAGTLTLTITPSGPRRPGVFLWKVPQPPSKVDGPSGVVYQNGWLHVPGSGGTITLTF